MMWNTIKRFFARKPRLEPRSQAGEFADGHFAERAIACARWRWTPGMAALASPRSPHRIRVTAGVDVADGWLPDFDDPATVGCLRALVLEAWGCREDRVICIEYDVSAPAPGPFWTVVARHCRWTDPWETIEASPWFRTRKSRAKRVPDVVLWRFGSPKGARLAFESELVALVYLLEAAP